MNTEPLGVQCVCTATLTRKLSYRCFDQLPKTTAFFYSDITADCHIARHAVHCRFERRESGHIQRNGIAAPTVGSGIDIAHRGGNGSGTQNGVLHIDITVGMDVPVYLDIVAAH